MHWQCLTQEHRKSLVKWAPPLGETPQNWRPAVAGAKLQWMSCLGSTRSFVSTRNHSCSTVAVKNFSLNHSFLVPVQLPACQLRSLLCTQPYLQQLHSRQSLPLTPASQRRKTPAVALLLVSESRSQHCKPPHHTWRGGHTVDSRMG